MAEISGGLPSYVLSGENLELKLAQVFRQLYGPVFRNVRYSVCSLDGREQPGRVQDAHSFRTAAGYLFRSACRFGRQVCGHVSFSAERDLSGTGATGNSRFP